ncbi:hypothetical protein BaRGS_00031361, partial [Batillaria attramentaria]
INPGRVGGACFDVDPVCDDPNAVCGPNNTCMCNEPFETGTADLNCVSPAGKPGGYCNDWEVYCDDPNAFCSHTFADPSNPDTMERVCECRTGYRTNTSDLTCEINPGRVGGACFDVDPVCDDPNAVCGPKNTCMCNEPFETGTADLNCVIPVGKPGGYCNDWEVYCDDPNAVCSYTGHADVADPDMMERVCQCRPGYHTNTSDLTCGK